MSTTENRSDRSDVELIERPTHSLEHMVDDAENPSTLTIFSPEHAEITTHWITVDIDSVVALEDVR